MCILNSQAKKLFPNVVFTINTNWAEPLLPDCRLPQVEAGLLLMGQILHFESEFFLSEKAVFFPQIVDSNLRK